MSKPSLGNLKTVDLREVFPTENKDFTPWLSKNLDLIGEKLGLTITDGKVEERISTLTCDIIAKDSDSGKTIVIQNQFGSTNPDHLGRLIT